MVQTRVFEYKNGKWEPIYVLGKCACEKNCGHGETWINYSPSPSLPINQVIGPSWELIRTRVYGY